MLFGKIGQYILLSWSQITDPNYLAYFEMSWNMIRFQKLTHTTFFTYILFCLKIIFFST